MLQQEDATTTAESRIDESEEAPETLDYGDNQKKQKQPRDRTRIQPKPNRARPFVFCTQRK